MKPISTNKFTPSISAAGSIRSRPCYICISAKSSCLDNCDPLHEELKDRENIFLQSPTILHFGNGRETTESGSAITAAD